MHFSGKAYRVPRFFFALWLIAAFAAAGAPAVQAEAPSKSVSASLDVDAGKTSAMRFRNAPAAGHLSVTVRADGPVGVIFLAEREIGKAPGRVRALYRGEARDSLRFAVTLPAAGNYLLIADNREGNAPRSVSVQAVVELASVNAGAKQVIEKAFAAMQKRLKSAFEFDAQRMEIVPCGRANAYSRQNVILVCDEYLYILNARLRDRGQFRDVLLFTILHELGHALLRQWGYPFYDNEEIADEFATAVLVMFNEKAAARHQAAFFASLPADMEIANKAGHFDRHPVSVQRARNILKWLDDDAFARKWQTIFVPHMQTAALEQLLARPAAWTDTGRIRNELSRRTAP